MICEPRISVICDQCDEEYDDYGLTGLAGGGWDDRNIEPTLKREGWLVEDGRHICPECVDGIAGCGR